MMTALSAGSADHVVEGTWLTLAQSVTVRDDEVLVVATLASRADVAVAIRVVDAIPESWTVRTIGVHSEYEPPTFEADPATITFEEVVEPGDRTTVVYGIRLAKPATTGRLGPAIIKDERLLDDGETSRDDPDPAHNGSREVDGRITDYETETDEFVWTNVGSTQGRTPNSAATDVPDDDPSAGDDDENGWDDLANWFETADEHDDGADVQTDEPFVTEPGGGTIFDELTDLPGVSPETAEALRAAGFHTISDLRRASETDLAAVAGVGRTLAPAIAAYLDSEAERPPSGEAESVAVDESEPSAGTEPPTVSAGANGQEHSPETPAGAREALAEAGNVLVLADHDVANDGCVHLLEDQSGRDGSLLLVSFVEAADERIQVLSRLPDDDRDVNLFCMGEHLRSSTAETTTVSTPHGEATVTSIADSADLFRLGVHVSRTLDDVDEGSVLCLHPLTALVALVDLQRLFRFIHVLSGRVRAAGGRAHYHLDPDSVDERTVATLRPLFDAVVRYDDGRFALV